MSDDKESLPVWQRVPGGGRQLAIAETLPEPIRGDFNARWARVADCIALRTPDQMPVSLIASFWYARYGGISCRDLMYEYERSNEISLRAIRELDPDVAIGACLTASYGPVFEAIDFRQLTWPGHGAPETGTYQYLDREYMLANEYDDFLFDPTAFMLEKFLPRIAGAYDGLQPLGGLAGNYYLGAAMGGLNFVLPQVSSAIERLQKAGREALRAIGSHVEFGLAASAAGYPTFMTGSTMAPYDVLADYMRGAKNLMTDLFRRPDQVEAAVEKIGRMLLKSVLANTPRGGSPIVFIPIHWGPDRFMSQKTFEKFFWPPLRKLMLGIIEDGLVPMLLWEADCTKRLETIADVPPGTCLYWFEATDMVRANEVLRDRVALHGNIGASVLATGSPADVDAAVRHLVESVYNHGGKLILSTSSPVPDESSVENVRAMFSAARKYGA